ncbi:MAG: aspartate aminotransferase family protein [Maricaulis sp.]|nr:aspartate aminotransferase family protein [Maricaulis sp.]
MDVAEFELWSKRIAEWSAEYRETLRDRSVRPNVAPGETLAQIPASPPDDGTGFSEIFAEFARLIPDAMTHWQHPRFFAYFPANAALPSVLAEQIVSTIAAQCMLWQTSPAATELETRMIDWLRQAMGLPDGWRGVIQDSASSATLSAVLTMRERALDFKGIHTGLSGHAAPRIYASAQAHSSVDKAIWVAGIGQDNLVKIPTRSDFGMDPEALRAAIAEDRRKGLQPAGIILCVGGTGIGACDPVAAILDIAREEDLYTHVDAAWAGSAMICPEFRPYWDGVEHADSIVFNPHKWLGAQFDCSVQFLKDPTDQLKTLTLRPDYLETPGFEDVVNYSEWTIPLGRRFRALKLWFLIRYYGLDGLRQRIRNHIAWAKDAERLIGETEGLEITTPCSFSLFSFACSDGDDATAALLERINTDGRTYLTQTRHQGRSVIRFQVGQFDCTRQDVLDGIAAVRALHAG